MVLTPEIKEVVERQQQELRDEFLPKQNTPTEYANLEAQKLLCEVRSFEYPKGSGTWYDVPNIPYAKGARLSEIYNSILEMKGVPHLVSVGVFSKLFDEQVSIMWGLSIPRGRIARTARRIGMKKNVFKRASEGDLVTLLSFFLVRRMASNVQFLYPAHLPTINPNQ